MYLIDACNVTYALQHGDYPVPRSFDALRIWFVEAVQGIVSSEKTRAIAYFDGRPGRNGEALTRPDVRVIFTYEREADDLIRETLDGGHLPSTCVVVTSDREIASYARSDGIRVVSKDDFCQRLVRAMQRKSEHKARAKEARRAKAHHSALPLPGSQDGMSPTPTPTPAQVVQAKRNAEQEVRELVERSEGLMRDMLEGIDDWQGLVEEALREPLPPVPGVTSWRTKGKQ